MDELRKTGRVTIPTDLDVVPETLEILKKWGADAIRDCDGTDFPQQLKDADAKIYSTYYTTRKDNAWAKANPDEVQQCYIMTGFYTAPGDTVTIPLMKGISPELMQVNTNDDIPLVGGHGPNHRSARAPGTVELRRRQRDGAGRAVPRVHRQLSGLPDLGPGAHVQCYHQRLDQL